MLVARAGRRRGFPRRYDKKKLLSGSCRSVSGRFFAAPRATAVEVAPESSLAELAGDTSNSGGCGCLVAGKDSHSKSLAILGVLGFAGADPLTCNTQPRVIGAVIETS